MLNLVFPSEEPEEEVSFEDIEERAKSGDAKSQTKVSVSEQIANAVDLNKHMAAQQRPAKCWRLSNGFIAARGRSRVKQVSEVLPLQS